MSDSDLLAIQRKRMQERRCVKCGAAEPRINERLSIICRTCFDAGWRYCHACETIKPVTACTIRRTPGPRASVRCKACDVAQCTERRRRVEVDYATRRARERAQVDARLQEIVKLYRAGLTIREIAETLGDPYGTVMHTIHCAREDGRWPKKLKRGRGWRKGKMGALV